MKMKKLFRQTFGDLNTLKIKRCGSIIGNTLKTAQLPKKININTEAVESIAYFGTPNKETYFGYYDRSPFQDEDTNIILCQASKRFSPSNEKLEILIANRDDPQEPYRPITNSNAWSLQQACFAQWLPRTKDTIIYNDVSAGKYVTKLINIKSRRVESQLETPSYCVSHDGKYILSCDMARLGRLRPGYGYSVLPDNTAAELEPQDTGVTLTNIKTGQSRLLVSVKELAQIPSRQNMKGAQHYVNHIMFNPASLRFSFFHLWVNNGSWGCRLFTLGTEGNDLRLISDNYVSHYCWVNNETIVAYSSQPNRKNQYYLYTDQPGAPITNWHIKGIDEDGHCTSPDNGETLLTDTYPNTLGQQRLIIAKRTGEIIEIARLYSPPKYSFENRCDLHPRADRTSQYISIDTTARGYREMAVLKLRNAPRNLLELAIHHN